MNLKLRNIPFSPPDITEAEAKLVTEALLSGWITTGPRTKEFERRIAQFCHTNKAVCLNSATAAMEMTLRVLGVGEGDEIIVPAYTYTATASVGIHVGAKVVMVDSQKDNVEMDYEDLERAITPKTKVIIPVDLGGIICDYDKVYEIVERKRSLFSPNNDIQRNFSRIIVMGDSAHGFGAERQGKMSGEWADFTCFSFHAVKNLTTAEGGAVVWRSREGLDDDAIYHEYQLLSLHGQNKDALAKTQLGAWEYDIKGAYYKCNMTDIMAAIGLVQLDRYPQLLARRQQIIAHYNKGLSDLNVALMNHHDSCHTSSGHLYLVRMLDKTLEQRNAIITRMAELGVATNVHYKPLPMMTAYKALGIEIKDFPNAYNLFHNEITLPLHTRLTDEDIDYIVEALHEAII